MDLESTFRADFSSILADFPERIIIQSPGKDKIVCDAVVGELTDSHVTLDGGYGYDGSFEVHIQNNLGYSPRIGDVVVVHNRSYKVTSVAEVTSSATFTLTIGSMI